MPTPTPPTPNMGLTTPDVSVTTGPQWAQQINGDLSIIDSHNHTPSSGVQIPTAGININDDLSFNQSWSALDVKSVGFTSLANTISSLINRVYVSGGNLYFNNGNGTPVQITIGSSVAGVYGTITGSGFTAAYNSGTNTFSWQDAANSTPSTMDCGTVLVRPPTAGSFGIQLESPTSLPSNQVLRLPAHPAQQALVAMASNGVQTTATVNSTLTLTANSLSVASGGITSSQLSTSPAAVATVNIQPLAVTTAKIADSSVTPIKLGPINYAASSYTTAPYFFAVSSSSFSQITALDSGTMAASNTRPIMVMLDAAQSTSTPTPLSVINFSGILSVRFLAVGPSGTTYIGCTEFPSGKIAPGAVSAIFFPPVAGFYSFSIEVRGSVTASLALDSVRLVAYQL